MRRLMLGVALVATLAACESSTVVPSSAPLLTPVPVEQGTPIGAHERGYQEIRRTVDEEFGIVCYSMAYSSDAVAISCVEAGQ